VAVLNGRQVCNRVPHCHGAQGGARGQAGVDSAVGHTTRQVDCQLGAPVGAGQGSTVRGWVSGRQDEQTHLMLWRTCSHVTYYRSCCYTDGDGVYKKLGLHQMHLHPIVATLYVRITQFECVPPGCRMQWACHTGELGLAPWKDSFLPSQIPQQCLGGSLSLSCRAGPL